MSDPLQATGEALSPNQAFLALRKGLRLTQTEAAAAIQKKTMRPCALRTVQAWEAQPTQKSARPCPAWALSIMQAIASKAQKRER